MKQKTILFLILAAIAGLVSFMACANSVPKKSDKALVKEKTVCPQWLHPDSSAYNILGRALTDILFNPKRVDVFSVTLADSTNAENIPVEPYFVVDSLLGTLNKSQIATLDYFLLSDSRNYLQDSIKTMSVHRPIIAFNFKNKNGSALVWYSPIDLTWGIRHDDRQLLSYSIGYYTLMNRFCNSFLKKPIINI